jgi:hypothetical protein
MKYNILSGHTGIHGSLMNLLDLTDYLVRKEHDVDFICLDRFHLETNLKKTNRRYKLGNVFDKETLTLRKMKTSGVVIKRDEIIITDFKSLISWPHPIICKKLIILDNAELSYHLDGIVIDFYPKDIGDIRKVLAQHKFQDHMFCMPPSNIDKFRTRYPDLNSRVFFKKINIEALCTAKMSDNGKAFYRGDNPPEGISELIPPPARLDDLTKVFNYNSYVYYRRADRAFYEQLGRLIFEFIILNKNVHFFDKPFYKKDGLNDYWEYYGEDRDFIIDEMLKDYEDAPWD